MIFIASLLFSIITSYCFGRSPEFVIIIPSYNNEKWAIENIDSAAKQDYEHFEIIYIDDCSTDNTLGLMRKYVADHKLEHRIRIVSNQKRQGALKNFYTAIHDCPDHKVIVMLDGDDKLADKDVLNYLASVYANKKIWITYGQFMHVPPGKIGSCREFPEEIRKNNRFRSHEWVASHLRTCYAGLFKKIKREDLLYRNEFCQMAWDNAIMFPMLEMASQDHIQFISKVLYIYNETNPMSDCRVDRQLVQRIEAHIKSQKPYTPLAKLDCVDY